MKRFKLFSSLLLAAFGASAITSTATAFSINSATSSLQANSGPSAIVEVGTKRRSVPSRFNRRIVKYNTKYKRGTIIVDTKQKYLYHVIGNGKAWRYGVGVGKAGFNWSGNVTIRRKAKWPGWTPPARMRAREARKGRYLPRYMAGGPKNPLGARALYLYRGGRDTLYRIHGTNNPSSIGLNVSSGCIRLRNSDVAHLYDRVSIGARVIVR